MIPPRLYLWLFFGLIFVVLAIITAKRRGEHLSNVMEDRYRQLSKQTVIVMIVIVVLAFAVLFIVNNFIINPPRAPSYN